MKIHSICLRKKLLGGLSEKWGSPLSVEQFMKKHHNKEKREKVLNNKADIVFFDENQEEIPYEKAIELLYFNL